MRHLLSALILAAFAATAQAQTMKALMYGTNGQVVYGGTNSLSFTNSVSFTSDVFGFSFEAASGSNYTQVTPDGVAFSGSTQKENTRANLGFSTNLNTLWTATNASNARSAIGLGATWLTNTNATNFRAAVGLGETNDVSFNSVAVTNAATTRTNLGAARAPIWAYKATNQTNSTTNLVSDVALTFTAAANTKYAVTLFLKMQFGADAAKGKILVSNAPTVIGHWTYYDTLNTQVVPTSTPMTNEALFFLADSQDEASFMQNFVVVAGTNNAPVTFQFARGSTNTNTVIVGAGSYIKAEVIE